MVLAIVILVLLLTLAFFHLKCSIMQSLTLLWSTILSTIIAFSYYEQTAGLFIARGFATDWALCVCFTLVFTASLALFRSISEFLIAAPVDLGGAVKISTSLVCGLLAGVIISGNLLVALGLLPMHGKIFYSRFDPERPVAVANPKTPALSTDGFVTGLYSMISSGSMSSGKHFGVFHVDYLSQIHLNKLKTKDRVLSVSSQKALMLPTGKDRKPVRRQTSGDKEVVIVRVGISEKDIKSGGAGKNMTFFPAQVRMIVKKNDDADEPLTGTATALYPVGLWDWKTRSLTQTKLNETITPDSKKIKDRIFWVDVAFQVPEKMRPILLEFKQVAVVDLTPYDVVQNTLEIEQALDSEEQEELS